MGLRYAPKIGSKKENLVAVDPGELFKVTTPTESRDALDEELEMHMNNANRRYNNLLISPQRKIIEDILLETPEGEAASAALIAKKIDERYARVTDYYIQTAKNFEPTNAAYELHRTLLNPVEKYGLDITGRVMINDYDEIKSLFTITISYMVEKTWMAIPYMKAFLMNIMTIQSLYEMNRMKN